MKKPSPGIIAYSLLSIFTLILGLANIYFVRTADAFGSPLLFALGLIIELLLIVAFVYSLIKVLRTPLLILGSILISAWTGVIANPYVKRFKKARPKLTKWLASRFDRKKPYGLYLTIGVVIALFFLNGFINVLQDVWFHEPLTMTDARVVNLMPSIRTPLQTAIYRFVTFTANTEMILLFVLLVAVILWRKRQKIAMSLFLLAVIVEEASSLILKQLVGRQRPVQSLSLIKEDSYSFPSGHVLRATVLFGLLTYLLYRSFRSSLLRLGIIIGYLISVILVASSRVYLGVHYPSDVLASVLFGAALLTLLITAIEIIVRFKLWQQSLKNFTNKLLAIVPVVIILISFAVSPKLVKLTSVEVAPVFATLPAVDQQTIKQLPIFSETLSGKKMEPISFVYIGSKVEIEELFAAHGWYKADPSTLANTLKALAVGFQGHQYLNAPVTPAYLSAKPEDLAFQQPTAANTLRQRHHTRLWQTNYKLPDGREVWVATASFDESVEFVGRLKLPTHHIDPYIDGERDYIVSSLQLNNVHFLQVVPPQAGKNASGDLFFTDGRAAVVEL